MLAAAAVATVALLGLAAWRTPIRPLGYDPPAAPPLAGETAPNHDLEAAELLFAGALRGPETIVADAAGRVYTGTLDGRVLRIDLASGRVETLAVTGGRPLGMRLDRDGRLLVADAVRGLLAVAPDGRLATLATSADGQPLRFADDLDVGSDGSVYVSDASVYGVGEYLFDLLEARPHGRLIRYDPATGRAHVLLSGLYFANGVALSQDESFVLVNETYRYRITRYWLKGPRAGSSDVFADNLPGFADGVSSNGRGTFWVALFTVRNPVMDALHPHPILKRMLSGLPRPLWPKPRRYGLVLALDEQGRIVRSLHDPTGSRIQQVTAAYERGGFLYLGSLDGDAIRRVKL